MMNEEEIQKKIVELEVKRRLSIGARKTRIEIEMHTLRWVLGEYITLGA